MTDRGAHWLVCRVGELLQAPQVTHAGIAHLAAATAVLPASWHARPSRILWKMDIHSDRLVPATADAGHDAVADQVSSFSRADCTVATIAGCLSLRSTVMA